MMDRRKQLQICAVLLVLNLAFIWGNSLLPAPVSRAFSDWVMSIMGGIPMEEAAQTGSGVLRKIAHFAEFTSLGVLLGWRMLLLGRNCWLALPAGMAAACLDETVQMFVPERGPGFRDVAIDSCGVLAGILLLKIGYVIIMKQRQYGGK